MGKKSTRENKTIFQICREEKNLTRETASEKMAGVSASRIERLNMNNRNQHLTIFCRWRIATVALIYAITTVRISATSAKSTFLKFQLPSCQASSWKPSQA